MSITADATITSKGQVTIPKEIRERLGLEAGQRVEFVLGEGGAVEVRPKRPALERLRAVRETIAARTDEIDVDQIDAVVLWATGPAPAWPRPRPVVGHPPLTGGKIASSSPSPTATSSASWATASPFR